MDADLAARLTNYSRSFTQLGLALLQAAGPADDVDDDARAAVCRVERALTSREPLIDYHALDVAFLCLLGLLCGKTRRTPKQILDHHWKHAPTDGDWRQMVDTVLERMDDERSEA